MRSGYADYSGIWGNPYYEDEVPPDLKSAAFAQREFQPGPALIALDTAEGVAAGEIPGTLRKYTGGAFDTGKWRLDPIGWDHEHCLVCNFCIDPGFTYWEDQHGRCLCDACYEHYVA